MASPFIRGDLISDARETAFGSIGTELQRFVLLRAMDVEGLLAEQVVYYRERAAEYDDWWERRGRYDQGPEFLAWWKAEIRQIENWLKEGAAFGSVLEIASGTGNLTRMLIPHAERIVAVDSSPETLAINASKNGNRNVDYIAADVFAWDPQQRFDTVAFGFWLSHVPESRFELFWNKVGSWLNPGGRALLVDNRPPADYSPDKRRRQADAEYDYERGTSQRVLEDGRSYEIVKVFRTPAQLKERLDYIGWHAEVEETDGAFIYGTATQQA